MFDTLFYKKRNRQDYILLLAPDDLLHFLTTPENIKMFEELDTVMRALERTLTY